LQAAGAATALAALPGALHAQAAWPTRPLRVVVPFPPGGTTDFVTRLVCTEVAKALGQPIVVENKPGAGTVIGVDNVAKSPPDGTSFVTVANSFAANVTLVKKLPYDPLKDLRPVALMGMSEHVLATHPGSGIKSVADLRTAARKGGGTLSYASFGNGTSAHLSGAALAQQVGLDLVHVPYKGQAPALTDLLGGQVTLMFGNWPEFRSHVQSGKLVAIGMATAKRSAYAPDIPTLPWANSHSSPRSPTSRHVPERAGRPAQGHAPGRHRRPQGDQPPLPRAGRGHHRGVRHPLAGQRQLPHQLRAALQGQLYTSNELPHFISNMPFECPGNPALGQLLAKVCNEHGVETLAHDATTLDPEYGTLVPMRYMNADQHFKAISVSAMCTVHYLDDSARLGWAMRQAIEKHYDGTVAFLASGSLSHRFAQNGLAPEYAFKIWSPFLEQLDSRVVEMWKAGQWKTSAACCPSTPAKATAKASCTTPP
jgi:tripartite-type tricarboxylate transporter receptor subunit TctC